MSWAWFANSRPCPSGQLDPPGPAVDHFQHHNIPTAPGASAAALGAVACRALKSPEKPLWPRLSSGACLTRKLSWGRAGMEQATCQGLGKEQDTRRGLLLLELLDVPWG